MDRRQFLRLTVLGGAAMTASHNLFPALASAAPRARAASSPAALLPPDANGMRLPPGFTSRVLARTGEAVEGTDYVWHAAPDGGAAFPIAGGGWVYVSNSELGNNQGGVGYLRFDNRGNIVDAGRALSGTNRNCAGGPTPWGTWLSCEETGTGRVWECDPLGRTAGIAHPAMGRFNHEAAVVAPASGNVYLTEDRPDGGLYRFRPVRRGDLSRGTLQVLAEPTPGILRWVRIPDPEASTVPTRYQVAAMKRFNGGEGAWFDGRRLLFTTKGDNRVWSYEPRRNQLEVIYDIATSDSPVLSGVDNVVASRRGDIFVAEDGGDMQLVELDNDGHATPFLQLVGQDGSELTGPAFDPSGSRLYISSQRPGTTYEISGPFQRSR